MPEMPPPPDPTHQRGSSKLVGTPMIIAYIGAVIGLFYVLASLKLI